MKQDSKRNWYVGDVKVRSDSLDDIGLDLKRAVNIATANIVPLSIDSLQLLESC